MLYETKNIKAITLILAISIFISYTEALITPAQKNASLVLRYMHTSYYRGSPVATYAGMTIRSSL